jgi:3alpha(or 20beta)-hydroxysteroid dehydrogenase
VREGAKVVLTDIRDELGERAATALRANGHDVRYMHLDVTSEQNWAQVVDAVMAAHGSCWRSSLSEDLGPLR